MRKLWKMVSPFDPLSFGVGFVIGFVLTEAAKHLF